MSQKIQNNYLPSKTMKWLLILVTVFLLLLTATAVFAFSYQKMFEYRFFPGVKILNQPLNELNVYRATNVFQKEADEFLQQGISYKFRDQEVNIPLISPATAGPDLSLKLIDFKMDMVAAKAFAVGRDQGYHNNFIEQMRALLFGINVPLEYEFYQEEFSAALENNLEKLVVPKTEAKPQFDEELNLEILSESEGTSFNYQLILSKTINQINNLATEPIIIDIIKDEPAVKKAGIPEDLIKELEEFVATSTITFIYNEDSWEVTNQVFKDWIIFKKSGEEIVLGLDASTTTAYLTNQITPDINVPVQDAKFDISDGKVTEFVGSRDGLELNPEKTIEKMEEALFKNQSLIVELVVTETKAVVSTASVNDLGITEILGTGYSDFGGSPGNRRHNISVGASTLNGVIINPGEEFSVIKALGKINAETGYLPELVIKGDRTVPEYGGGLCQIGTTVYRAALASGLEVTERRPHSYRVVYYEPAGTDATIYDPRPDVKFINDTGKHVLIQSRIEGDSLYFDFWGTNDGRIVEQSDPVIYNIVGAGPVQNIETEELEPGQKNCIESAHAGADAYFDYKITYPNGEIKEERVTSHYVPWPAKCLVGAEPAAATLTPEIVE